jgi:hypothetical protein
LFSAFTGHSFQEAMKPGLTPNCLDILKLPVPIVVACSYQTAHAENSAPAGKNPLDDLFVPK